MVASSCSKHLLRILYCKENICFLYLLFFVTPTWIFTMTRKNVDPRKNVQSGSGSVSPES